MKFAKVTVSGVHNLMQSLPESLQQFDLNLCCTKVSDLGKRSLPATLTELHLNLFVTPVTGSGMLGLMRCLTSSRLVRCSPPSP